MSLICRVGCWIVWIIGGAEVIAGSFAMLWALMARDVLTMMVGLGLVTGAACMIAWVNEERSAAQPP